MSNVYLDSTELWIRYPKIAT